LATEKTSVEIIIEAQNRAAAAIGQAISDQKRFAEEIKKSKAAADGSYESNLRVGRALLGQRDATQRLSTELSKLQTQHGALTATQGQLKDALSGVTQGLADQAGGLGRFAAAIGPWGVAIGAGVGILTALGTAAVNAANQIGDYQEAVDIAAEQTGLTVKEIGGLRVAASNVGRDFESIAPSLQIFVRHIGEAADGSVEAGKSFAKLGVDIKDQVTGAIRPTGEVLKDVAARLNALPDPANRARAAFELFGRGASSILPILSQDLTAAEDLAEKLGITLSPAMQKVARDADVAGDKLKLSFMGAVNQLTLILAPAGTAILNFVNGAIENFRKLADFLDEHLLGAFKDLKATSDELKGPDPSKATVSVGQISVVNKGPSEQAKELVKQAREQLETLQKLIPLLDYQRSIGAITIDQEVKKLEAMKAQALTARELLIINQKIAALRPPVPGEINIGFGPKENPLHEQWRREGANPEGRAVTQEIMGAGEMQAFFGAQEHLLRELEQMSESTEQLSRWFDIAEDSAGNLQETTLGLAEAFHDAVMSTQQVAYALGTQAVSGVRSVVHEWIEGTGKIGDAVRDMVKQTIEMIATQLILRTGASLLGIPLPFAQGGVVYAASGLVTSGVHGKDSTLAMLQPRERVLNVRRNDEFEGLLSKLASMVTTPQSTSSSSRSEPRQGPVTVNVTVHGSLADDRSLRELAEERIAPVVERALARNAVRR